MSTELFGASGDDGSTFYSTCRAHVTTFRVVEKKNRIISFGVNILSVTGKYISRTRNNRKGT